MVPASSIKRKVVLTVIYLCVINIAVITFFAYLYQMHQLRQSLKDLAKNEAALFDSLLAGDAEGLARAHVGIDREGSLLRPFAARNKEKLLAAARPMFKEMRQNNGITHMYFIEPDGRVLLRVHKPEEAGDVLTRSTFLKAQATRRIASGIELGMNFFSLRCVTPAFLEGKLIGFIEVAEEIDHVFTRMKQINGTDVCLLLSQAFVTSQPTHVTGIRAGDFTIFYPTRRELARGLAATLQPRIRAALNQAEVVIVPFEGGRYAVGMAPVRDAGGVTVGVLFAHRDVTPLFSSMWGAIALFTVTQFIILLVSLFLLYLSLRKSLALFGILKAHMASVTTTWDLSRRLRIDKQDEIGELAQEFNAMTDKLHGLTMELEQRLTDKEQMLIHQSRMAAMGEMIGFIAHQWRQPLNTLGLIVQELPVYFKRGAFTEEYLDESTSKARELIAHMSQTVEDFRGFFRAEREKVSFTVKDVLDRTLKLVGATFASQNIAVDVVAEDDCLSQGYPNEYGQVILNILQNASDVFRERNIERRTIAIRIFKEEGKCVLTILDNAGGIPEKNLDRIFDPYFTTKPPEKGTGLGLYMAKAIIEKNMGGKITVRNSADGAEFRIEV